MKFHKFAVILCAGWAGWAFTGCVAPQEAPVAPLARPLPVPDKAQWQATASGAQEEGFEAANACDGRLDTRWSAPFTDPQWLQIDLGATTTVCGLTLHWEDAYSSEYRVETSLDARHWTLVYDQRLGDGHTDDVYFRSTSARYLRLTGTKRATGWGHSLWELDVKGAAEQIAVTADTATKSSPERLTDGFTNTFWISQATGPQSITLDFQQAKSIGGVRVDWGAVYAVEADLLLSTDGAQWKKAGEIRHGTGRFDVLMHPAESVRFVRLDVLKLSKEKPMQIAEISFRGPDEVITPLALYQLAASKAEVGYYPDHLRKRQVYWTLVGLPKDGQESLLDEYGNLEPKAGSGSLMPYLYEDGKLYSAFQARTVEVALTDRFLPLPSVAWKQAGGLDLKVEALAAGESGASATLVRYRLTNPTDRTLAGSLFLAMRPVQINPEWQHGGLSPIRSLTQTTIQGRTCALINGLPAYVSLTPPAGFGIKAFHQGDIVEELRDGQLPASAPQEASEWISGAWQYPFELPPGGTKDVLVAAPLYAEHPEMKDFDEKDPGAWFDRLLAQERERWMQWVDRVRIRLPQQDVADMMKAQISYILINQDGVSIQPGSRAYKRAWIRDGSLTSAGMLRMGLTNEVREYLDWYSRQVQPDGWVPPILESNGSINKGFGWDNEYDSQGQYIFAVLEYYRFTKDRAFLERHFDQVVNALKYLIVLRDRTLADGYMAGQPAPERFRGILPASISHEGYSPAMHSYWDDFFALKGWKDGREAAEILGRDDLAKWAGEQYEIFRQSLVASIQATIAFKKIDYVPGCAEKGDPDPTSTTIAFFPCQEGDVPPAEIMQRTFDRYYEELVSRKNPKWVGAFTPYEVRSITSFIRLGQKDRAKTLLDYMLSCRRPLAWNHLGEVVHSDPRQGSYIGDMPHTWVGSGYINAVRGMLVYEQDGRLHLLAGAPAAWLEADGLELGGLPTHFGPLNLTAHLRDRQLQLHLDGVTPPQGIVLYWPQAEKPADVTVNGQPWSDFNDKTCTLPADAQDVVAHW